MLVTARYIDVSAVKNSYNEKNAAAAMWGVTTGEALSVCIYIFYTACGDQVKCSSLFHEREGRRVSWTAMEKFVSQTVNKLLNGF
jgi:hypothetical protein